MTLETNHPQKETNGQHVDRIPIYLFYSHFQFKEIEPIFNSSYRLRFRLPNNSGIIPIENLQFIKIEKRNTIVVFPNRIDGVSFTNPDIISSDKLRLYYPWDNINHITAVLEANYNRDAIVASTINMRGENHLYPAVDFQFYRNSIDITPAPRGEIKAKILFAGLFAISTNDIHGREHNSIMAINLYQG